MEGFTEVWFGRWDDPQHRAALASWLMTQPPEVPTFPSDLLPPHVFMVAVEVGSVFFGRAAWKEVEDCPSTGEIHVSEVMNRRRG